MPQETTITIDFVELADSPIERFGPHLSATRRLRCAWDDRLTLANELMGQSIDKNGEVTLLLGHLYPHQTFGQKAPRVMGISGITGFPSKPESGSGASTARVAEYTHAILDVDYDLNQSSFTPEDDDYVIKDSIGGGIEFLTIPTDGFNIWWTAESVPVKSDVPTVQIVTTDWFREIKEVASLPSTFYSLRGHVNSTAFNINDYISSPDPGTVTFEKETLLFIDGDADTEFTSNGGIKWKVRLRFSHRATVASDPREGDVAVAGWNHFFQPAQTKAERIYTSSAARGLGQIYKPYPLGNLTTLLDALS